jgi:hypothetical protein
MKLNIAYCGILILAATFLHRPVTCGQEGTYLEKIEAIRKDFFTERLELTPDEASKFWPVYSDFNNRREKINEDRRILFRYVTRNSEFLTEKEINDSLEKYLSLEKEETVLAEQFNQKFLSILPPKKVLKIYVTENQFKAYILNQIRNNRQSDRMPGRVRQ